MKTRLIKVFFMAFLMVSLGMLASCSKDDPAVVVDKTGLVASITAANLLLTTTFEGVAAGNYLKGSQHPLSHAVVAAQVISDLPEVSQATVNGTKGSLDAAITTYGTQLVVPIDPTNLAGQWTFDEIATVTVNAVVKDYSGNSRNGAIKAGHAFWGAGTPTLVADRYGIAGKALRFDKGGNVEIPYSAGLNPPIMSLSVWAKPDVNTPIVNNQYFISMNRWNGYKFNFQDFPRAFFTVTYDNAAAVPPVTKVCCYDRDQDVGKAPQGSWHHYVVTFGNGRMIFYIDGLLIKDWPNAGTVSTLTTPVALVFGQDLPTSVYVTTPDSHPNYVNWGGFYIGALDEVRLYKSVLTVAQVTAIYNLEKP